MADKSEKPVGEELNDSGTGNSIISDASIPPVTTSDIEMLTPASSAPGDSSPSVDQRALDELLLEMIANPVDLHPRTNRIPKALRDIGVMDHFQVVLVDSFPELRKFLTMTRDDHGGSNNLHYY